MQQDRDYYRSMSTRQLLAAAKDYGLNAEMAIAIVERLEDETAVIGADSPAEEVHAPSQRRAPGHYHFNHNTGGN